MANRFDIDIELCFKREEVQVYTAQKQADHQDMNYSGGGRHPEKFLKVFAHLIG